MALKNEIYAGVIVPARDAADGETPTRVVLTEENNGYAIWLCDHDENHILEFQRYGSRNICIERAVETANEHRAAVRAKQAA